MLILLAALALGADCPDPRIRISSAEFAVLELAFAEVDLQLKQAVQGWACGDPADKVALSRYWVTEAMRYRFDGQEKRGVPMLAAARRVAPESFNEDFGEEAKKAWAFARVAGMGRIDVRGLPPKAWVAVDGARVDAPLALEAGVHLVQAGLKGAPAGFARIVAVSPDATVTVDLPPLTGPAVTPPAVVDAPVQPPADPEGPPVWLAGGVAVGLGSLAHTHAAGGLGRTDTGLSLGVSSAGNLGFAGPIGMAWDVVLPNLSFGSLDVFGLDRIDAFVGFGAVTPAFAATIGPALSGTTIQSDGAAVTRWAPHLYAAGQANLDRFDVGAGFGWQPDLLRAHLRGGAAFGSGDLAPRAGLWASFTRTTWWSGDGDAEVKFATLSDVQVLAEVGIRLQR